MSTNNHDAAHLAVLTAAARAYEAWHNGQVEPIIRRLIDSGEREPIDVQVPPQAIFETFRQIDADLRGTRPPAHEDRKQLAEVRCLLRDGLDDLCAYEIEHAVEMVGKAVNQLDWLLHHKSRAGSRSYRILDEGSAKRMAKILIQATDLLGDVTKLVPA
jgi:hypothetical protein